MLDVGVEALWRACRELRTCVAAGDAEGIREWVDELEVIAMWAEHPAVHSRAVEAIASSLPHVDASGARPLTAWPDLTPHRQPARCDRSVRAAVVDTTPERVDAGRAHPCPAATRNSSYGAAPVRLFSTAPRFPKHVETPTDARRCIVVNTTPCVHSASTAKPAGPDAG